MVDVVSVATALHRAIAEIRDTYGYDNAIWNDILDTVIEAYAIALQDERDAGIAA